MTALLTNVNTSGNGSIVVPKRDEVLKLGSEVLSAVDQLSTLPAHLVLVKLNKALSIPIESVIPSNRKGITFAMGSLKSITDACAFYIENLALNIVQLEGSSNSSGIVNEEMNTFSTTASSVLTRIRAELRASARSPEGLNLGNASIRIINNNKFEFCVNNDMSSVDIDVIIKDLAYVLNGTTRHLDSIGVFPGLKKGKYRMSLLSEGYLGLCPHEQDDKLKLEHKQRAGKELIAPVMMALDLIQPSERCGYRLDDYICIIGGPNRVSFNCNVGREMGVVVKEPW